MVGDNEAAELGNDDLRQIAAKLAVTEWSAEQLEGVAPLTQGLLEGVNALEQFDPSAELPALGYQLPEWE